MLQFYRSSIDSAAVTLLSVTAPRCASAPRPARERLVPGGRGRALGHRGPQRLRADEPRSTGHGRLEPDEGTVVRRSGLRVAMMDRSPRVCRVSRPCGSGLGAVRRAAGARAVAARAGRGAGRGGRPRAGRGGWRYGKDLDRFQHEGGYEIAARVDAVLAGLGFDPELARSQRVDTLSGARARPLGPGAASSRPRPTSCCSTSRQPPRPRHDAVARGGTQRPC